MFEEIIIAGAGGQGTLVMGEILAFAHHETGAYATFQPAYGSAKRGGESNCTVILSDKEIICPEVEAPKVLVCFNQESYDKLSETVAEGGLILVNSDEVKSTAESEKRTLVKIPAITIANKIGNPRGVNIVMLGALLEKRPLLTVEQVAVALRKIWGEKKAEKLLPVNLKALEAGRNSVLQGL